MITPEFIPYATIGPVPEGGSFFYQTVLVQFDGKTPIPNGSLKTMRMTLRDVDTGVIINGWDLQNCLNTNGMTVDVSTVPPTGELTWVPSPGDNPFLSNDPNTPEGSLELHVAIFQWTWNHPDGRILQNQRKLFINVERYAGTESPSQPGDGPDRCTLGFTNDVTGQPLVGAYVWITADSLGQTRISGTLKTNINGQVVFMLNNGATYYLWLQGQGFNAINGQAFTAQKDA